MKKQILKLSFISLIGAVFAFGADAAPVVKKLGTGTLATSSQTSGTAKKSTTVTPARASTARLNTSSVSSKAPVTSVKTSVTPAKAAAAPTSAESDDARLSLGKYLHGATISKEEQEQEAQTASLTLLNLQARVSDAEDDIDNLEADVEALSGDVAAHIANTDIHVTADEKAAWDDKQNALSAGPGVKIEEKNGETVISAIAKVPYGAEDGPRIIPMWVE